MVVVVERDVVVVVVVVVDKYLETKHFIVELDQMGRQQRKLMWRTITHALLTKSFAQLDESRDAPRPNAIIEQNQ
jgi:hypothetical protein